MIGAKRKSTSKIDGAATGASCGVSPDKPNRTCSYRIPNGHTEIELPGSKHRAIPTQKTQEKARKQRAATHREKSTGWSFESSRSTPERIDPAPCSGPSRSSRLTASKIVAVWGSRVQRHKSERRWQV